MPPSPALPPSDSLPPASPRDAYAALRVPAFRAYALGNAFAILGMQMQGVAVGWEIYDRTQSEFALGMVGLAQFLPVLLLALPAGMVIDTWPRQRVVLAALGVMTLASLGLAGVSAFHADYRLMYVFLALTGAARAFLAPGKSALLPLLVPADRFANAVTWNSSVFHFSSIAGPALGGWMIAVTRAEALVYLFDALATLTFAAALVTIRPAAPKRDAPPPTWNGVAAGFVFLGRNQVILGAMLLDMFAVLLGGAVTLLPVYARDILAVGPTGLGWLRAAPALGALAMAVALAHARPFDRSGRALLLSVVGFGVCTVVFGYSRVFALSLAALFLTGALDAVSVVIRHTLVQTQTPDALRGRVSAINSLFIGASNELGGFESGLVAALAGPVFSVVSGGLGTIAVAAVIAALFPNLRRFGKLDDDRQPPRRPGEGGRGDRDLLSPGGSEKPPL